MGNCKLLWVTSLSSDAWNTWCGTACHTSPCWIAFNYFMLGMISLAFIVSACLGMPGSDQRHAGCQKNALRIPPSPSAHYATDCRVILITMIRITIIITILITILIATTTKDNKRQQKTTKDNKRQQKTTKDKHVHIHHLKKTMRNTILPVHPARTPRRWRPPSRCRSRPGPKAPWSNHGILECYKHISYP